MDSAPAHGWVISDEKLREICPTEYQALIDALDKTEDGDTLGSLALAFQNEGPVDKDVALAYADLEEAFEKATTIWMERTRLDEQPRSLGSLKLCLQYHDDDAGGIYDEIEGDHYWDVDGMTQLTPAGKVFAGAVEEKSWTVFG